SCIGIGQHLVARGHRVVFALEQAWAGKIACYRGLEEEIYRDESRPSSDQANQFWHDFMRHYREKFRAPSTLAAITMCVDMEEEFFNSMLNVDRELARVIDRVKPDVIVLDSYNTVPAVHLSGRPWV